MVEFLLRKTNSRSTTRVWQATPSPLEEKNLGTLFAIIDIENSNALNDDIIEIITSDVQRYFYRSDSFDVESAFETALHKLNRRLQELIGEIGEDWLTDLTAVLGVQKGSTVVFANVGRAVAFMVHKQNIVDILDTAKAKAQDINPVKLFSNIVSGGLVPESFIVFGTESILDYLSKDRIRRLLQDYPGDQVAGALTDLLQTDTGTNNFAALILDTIETTVPEVEVATPAVEPALPSTVAEDSLHSLMNQQVSTQEMLSPAIWPRVKSHLTERWQALTAEKATTSSTPADGAADYEEHILRPAHSHETPLVDDRWKILARRAWKQTRHWSAIAWDGLRSGVQRLIQTIKHWQANRRGTIPTEITAASETMTNTPSQPRANQVDADQSAMLRRSSRQVQQFARQASQPLQRRWKTLTKAQQLFFVIATIVLCVFIYALMDRNNEKTNTTNEQSYIDTISQVNLKINEGKAALVYNETEANKLLTEAQQLLSQVPKDSATYQQSGADAERALNEQLAIIHKMTQINDLTPLVDFNQSVGGAAINAFLQLGNGLYVFAADNGKVWRGDTEKATITTAVDGSSGTPGVQKAIQYSPGTGLLLTKTNTFEIFNTNSQDVTPIDLPATDTKATPTDLRVFGGRLYTLDASNNQIYRYDISGSLFSAPVAWLTEKANIKEAVSFAIDGSIYVLKNNGTVVKFSGGVKDDFELSPITPALTSGTALFTDENTDTLYILDAANQRVVLFDKTGKLITQYTSNSFTNLSAMLVDEDTNTLYLLNGTQVFTVKLKKDTVAEG